MVHCIVFGCTNKTGLQSEFTGSFHRFPADKNLKRVWISKINRKDYAWRRYHHVCSEHFEESDFIISHETAKKIGFKPGKFQLHKSAIPTLKLRGNETEKQIKYHRATTAISKRENLELIASNICESLSSDDCTNGLEPAERNEEEADPTNISNTSLDKSTQSSILVSTKACSKHKTTPSTTT